MLILVIAGFMGNLSVIKNHLATVLDYIFGALIMIVCFMIMQKTLTMSIGMKYSDLPQKLKKQLAKKD